MNDASSLGKDAVSHSPVRLWTEFVIMGLGLPAASWLASKLIKLSIPAATHGSPGERFLWWITGPAIAEWLFVLAVVLVLRRRQLSLKDIGVWRVGNWKAWVFALAFAALSIGGNLRFLPRMGLPISAAFFPQGFHLAAALMMGVTAGFCEEVLFRAFLMTEFADAGYGKVAQVLIPGTAFGLSHAGYLNQGFLPWLGIAVPTAFIGMMWGVAYLLGGAAWFPELWPTF